LYILCVEDVFFYGYLLLYVRVLWFGVGDIDVVEEVVWYYGVEYVVEFG